MGYLNALRTVVSTAKRHAASASKSRLAITLILTSHFVLGLAYSLVTPAWEAHDEWAHYKYVEYIAVHHSLPPGDEPLTTIFGYDQATQPPLYYVLASLPVTWVDVSDGLEPAANPYATTGTGEGGVNMVVHDFSAESFPYRGTFLALHLSRLVSVLISLLGVWFTYLLARWLVPDHPAIIWLATAIAAFSPQYLFIGSVVTNDILIAALSSAVVYFACRVALDEPRGRDFVGVAVGFGLALLTKYTAFGLVPVVLVALVSATVRKARRVGASKALLMASVVMIVILALSGWWFGRNITLYGTPISRDQEIWSLLIDGLSAPADALANIPWKLVPQSLWYGFQTFWASFGWGNLGLPPQIYLAIAVLSGLSVLGCISLLISRKAPQGIKRAMLFLGFVLLALILPPLYKELAQGAAILRGRFLLTALPAVALLMSLGLLWWLPDRVRIGALGAVGGSLLILAVLVPPLVIRPAYATPEPPSSSALPEGAHAVEVRFGDLAELYGYEIWPDTVRVGEAVRVRLYWRALRRSDDNYSVGVYALGQGAQPYGQTIRFPGRGNYATSLWEPGDLMVDTFWVPIFSDRPVPCLGQIGVMLFLDEENPRYLPATDAAGNPLGDSAIFGRFKIAAAELPSGTLESPLATFGGQIALVGIELPEILRPGGAGEVTLRLQALRRPDDDYILFVQLLDGEGDWVAGVDGPPLAGQYPTGLWDEGETFSETRRLVVPRTVEPGAYRVALGFYRLETGERLPAAGPSGQALADGMWTSTSQEMLPTIPRCYLPTILRHGE